MFFPSIDLIWFGFDWLTFRAGIGIYGPGWEERRRARLTEKYGIDFDEVK